MQMEVADYSLKSLFRGTSLARCSAGTEVAGPDLAPAWQLLSPPTRTWPVVAMIKWTSTSGGLANTHSPWKYPPESKFLGSKIIADGDYSHEIKRCLFLGRKVMTNIDSILKSRDITLSTKVHLVKAMVFPVVTYGCESWTIKKAEHWRIYIFELWC